MNAVLPSPSYINLYSKTADPAEWVTLFFSVAVKAFPSSSYSSHCLLLFESLWFDIVCILSSPSRRNCIQSKCLNQREIRKWLFPKSLRSPQQRKRRHYSQTSATAWTPSRTSSSSPHRICATLLWKNSAQRGMGVDSFWARTRLCSSLLGEL